MKHEWIVEIIVETDNDEDFYLEEAKWKQTLVRCKDCEYNYHNMIPSGEAEHGCTKCVELPITADFYCAWGERKEDE